MSGKKYKTICLYARIVWKPALSKGIVGVLRMDNSF